MNKELQMINDYGEGLSSLKIAKKYCVSKPTVLKILHKNNVIIRYRHKKYFINENVFNIISEESAYWIGFIMADGCVYCKSRNSKILEIGLQKGDCEHLFLFKKFINSKHKISFYKNRCRISINSKKIVEKLNEFGVVPNKSYCAKINKLQYNKHFWRGMIDGDGCIYIGKCIYIQLCGTKDICEQFLEYCKMIICGIKSRVRKIKNANCYVVQINCNKAREIIRHLYRNSYISLKRKKMLADIAIQKKGGRNGRITS
jgi:hypothetical protein